MEQAEKRKDSQLAREINVALPTELNHQQKQILVRQFSQSQFVERGMVADVAYHDFQGQNPHAHILLTMREIDRNGFGKKDRRWNDRALLEQQRQDWCQQANEALERAGHEQKIDHRSLADQGLERLPQIHLGPQVMEMEMRGIRTEIGDEIRRRSRINRRISRWQQENQKLDQQIEQQRAQLEAKLTARAVENDHPKIESPQPETESTLETPQLTHEQSEDAPTIDRDDDEVERRRERYRQLYQHYSPGVKLTPQQRDLIVLNRSLSDGCEPVLALSIIGQGETAQTIKNSQGEEAAIDYLKQLYWDRQRRLEQEQERRQSRDLEWER